MLQYSITNYSPNPIHPPFDVETCGTATQPLVFGKDPEESNLAIGDLAKLTLSSGNTDELPKDPVSARKTIARLKAKIEARNSRDLMVTTRQMFSLLSSSHLKIDPGKLKEISSVLARQINEIVEDLDQYRGKSLPLESMKKNYPFYSFEKGEQEMRTLPFDCWFEVPEDGWEVKVFMTPPNEKPIGDGANKKVFRAQSLKIPLLAERAEHQNEAQKSQMSLYERESTCTPMVLVKIRKGKETEMDVESGIKIQEKIQGLAPLATFTALLQEPLPPTAPLSSTRKVYRQEWYNSDLRDAYKLKKIPLDISDTPATINFAPLDYLNIIIDVAKSLTEWHKAGFVHRDVKPKNILLKVSSDKETIQGILGDYDLAQKTGPGSTSKYYYWDALSEKGLATPFTDLYGLALTLAETCIPKFTHKEPSTILSEAQQKTYLLRVLEKHLQVPEDFKFYTREKVLKKAKKLLNAKIQDATGSAKKTFQLGLNEIHIVEGVIALTAQIVAANKDLSQSIGFPMCRTAEYIQDHTKYLSIETIQSCVAHDIKGCFPDTHTYRLITTKTSGWNKLPAALKIELTKRIIQDCLGDDSLEHEVNLKLNEALGKIENRESALNFFYETNKLDEQEQLSHPLYAALKNPLKLKTSEAIEHRMDREAKKTGAYLDKILFERVQKWIRGFNGMFHWRLLKEFYQGILNDKCETLEIKQEIREAQNLLIEIEKAMAFALEMRDFYKKKITEVSQTAPTLESFLEQLNMIKSKLIVTSSQEEKKE